MSKMILNIIGASRGSFTNDDNKQQDYGSAYATEDLRPDDARKFDAVGVMVIKYRLAPDAFAAIKAHKLPQEFVCDVEATQNATGIKMRLLSAKPMKA